MARRAAKRLISEAARYARPGDLSRSQLREAWRREAFFRVARNFTPTLECQWPTGRFVVATGDTVISLTTFVRGPFGVEGDLAACELLSELLPTFDLTNGEVLEAGANIGTGTLTFLAAGAQRVHAFEPAPESVRILRQTVAANGLEERVLSHRVALSNTVGSVEFELSPQTWGDHRVRVGAARGPEAFDESSRAVISVPSVTIDSLIADGTLDLDRIQVAWIDVQGHEAALLEGAQRLLATEIPIVVEFWPYGLSRAGGLDRFIACAKEHCTHVLNLNDALDGRDRRPLVEQLERPDSLDALSARYPDRDDHTNLALLSLGS